MKKVGEEKQKYNDAQELLQREGSLAIEELLIENQQNFIQQTLEVEIDHRLTQPNTPKTNGMVERVNGTIKNNTILKTTYSNENEMTHDVMKFLVCYNLYRRHGSLRKELNVKTPFQAISKVV